MGGSFQLRVSGQFKNIEQDNVMIILHLWRKQTQQNIRQEGICDGII